MTSIGMSFGDSDTMSYSGTTASITENSTTKNLDCDRLIGQNKSKFDFTDGAFDGIVYNIYINCVVTLIGIGIFTILRKKAFHYGRFGLLSRMKETWISKFYGDHENGNNELDESDDSRTQLDRMHLQHDNMRFYSWICLIFRVRLQHIRENIGPDAYEYLQFQQYLIIYILILMILSMVVILPINIYSENKIDNGTTFGHTTIRNLDPSSNMLWFHAVLSQFFIIPLFILRFIYKKRYFEQDNTLTLMISGIPTEQCDRNNILRVFREKLWPVADVQIAYNISTLINLDNNRKKAEEAIRVLNNRYEDSGIRPEMTSGSCGRWCCCCQVCGCKKVDAIDHYQKLLDDCHEKYRKEKETIKQVPIGIAFVTFEQSCDLQKLMRLPFCCTPICFSHGSHGCSFLKDLSVFVWDIDVAYSPGDIYWKNLSTSKGKWWMKAILVNVISLAVLYFYTTPFIIVNSLTEFKTVQDVKDKVPWLIDFLLTLLLWILSAFMPNVVYIIDSTFICYWRRTTESHLVMVKTFIFLFFMVLILPSLGISSAKQFLEWYIVEPDVSFKWRCAFLPRHSAFFVNYVMTAALIGTTLELLRFPELFVYFFKILFARSDAEKAAIGKIAVHEFQYGPNYAWMMCIFAVIFSYSFVSPLVVPVGLLYIVLKHGVDRYNIYFAYKPSKLHKKIHNTAINFMIFGVIVLQFNIFYYILSASKPNGYLLLFLFLCQGINSCTLVFDSYLKGLFRADRLKKLVDALGMRQLPPMQTHERYVPDVLLDKVSPQAKGSGNNESSYGTMNDATNNTE